MEHSVGQVPGYAGVTVRALRHADGSGLLAPGARSHAGRRRCDDADLGRPRRILFHREPGFALDGIAVLLDDPDVDPQEHLRRRHALLSHRIAGRPAPGRPLSSC